MTLRTPVVFCAVSAMPGSAGKRTNLMLLLDYAAVYENAGYIGLSGFIRFIDRLERTKATLPGRSACRPKRMWCA